MDKDLGEQISVTIIATGFKTNSIPELYIKKKNPDKIKLPDKSEPVTEDIFTVTDKEIVEAADKSNIQKTFEFDNDMRLVIDVSVTNVYDRANVFYIDRFTAEVVNQLPILPALGINYYF